MDQDFWDIWYGRPTVHLIHHDAVRLGRKVGLSVMACRFYVISSLCFFIYKTGFSDPDFFFYGSRALYLERRKVSKLYWCQTCHM